MVGGRRFSQDDSLHQAERTLVAAVTNARAPDANESSVKFSHSSRSLCPLVTRAALCRDTAASSAITSVVIMRVRESEKERETQRDTDRHRHRQTGRLMFKESG